MKKFHAISRFATGSFVVHTQGLLRPNLRIISGLAIICGRRSFAALYTAVRLASGTPTNLVVYHTWARISQSHRT